MDKYQGLDGLGRLQVQVKGVFAVRSRFALLLTIFSTQFVLLLTIFSIPLVLFCNRRFTILSCSDTRTLSVLQERKERKQTFLDPDDVPMTIDDAMAALLDVGGQQFKNNVELYGAVHTDELRYTLASAHQQQETLMVLMHAGMQLYSCSVSLTCCNWLHHA